MGREDDPGMKPLDTARFESTVSHRMKITTRSTELLALPLGLELVLLG